MLLKRQAAEECSQQDVWQMEMASQTKGHEQVCACSDAADANAGSQTVLMK